MRQSLSLLLLLPLVVALVLPDLVAAAPASRNGLQIVYEDSSDPSHQELRQFLKRSGVFEAIAQDLNASLDIPCPMVVRFTACDEENAYYDPSNNEISMCYELIDKYRLIYTDETSTPAEVEAEVVNAALFTFFHELGHGLVDVWDLPITGKEEDAVDEFAAVMLLSYGGQEGEDALLAAVDQFAIDAEETAEHVNDISEMPFWDVHSMDQERFYDLLCVIYGSDPQRYDALVTEGDLPEDRASGCEEEYERKSRVWEALLQPHLK